MENKLSLISQVLVGWLCSKLLQLFMYISVSGTDDNLYNIILCSYLVREKCLKYRNNVNHQVVIQSYSKFSHLAMNIVSLCCNINASEEC